MVSEPKYCCASSPNPASVDVAQATDPSQKICVVQYAHMSMDEKPRSNNCKPKFIKQFGHSSAGLETPSPQAQTPLIQA